MAIKVGSVIEVTCDKHHCIPKGNQAIVIEVETLGPTGVLYYSVVGPYDGGKVIRQLLRFDQVEEFEYKHYPIQQS